MELQLRSEAWPYATPFRITNYQFTTADVLTVRLSDGGLTGWGEAGGVYYHGETPTRMSAQIEAVRPSLEAGLTRESLRHLLPPGGSRWRRASRLSPASRLGRTASIWADMRSGVSP